jgi:hypothetical protein
MGGDLTASALVRLASASLSPVVVIQHELRVASLRSSTERLIDWYLRSCWGTLCGGRRGPLFTIFLNVIYPAAPARFSLGSWIRRRTVDKRQVQERVRRIVADAGAACPAVVLGELGPVTVDDVKSWFSQNGIYESEHRRHELAQAIFESATVKPLAEVELALERIHRDFVRHVSGSQRAVR